MNLRTFAKVDGALRPDKTGADLLHDPSLNKGTAFPLDERERLGLTGLLPPYVSTMEQQVRRVLENVRRQESDLSRYIEMISLLDRNETLFYRVLVDNIEELMPIVYTPTVGKACQLYGHIFRRARGLFITRRERGRIREVLSHWRHPDVRVIVVTDGARILGLGDLGANGMGIPVGKLSLYTACGGVEPTMTLPVTLDVGTNEERLLADPLYLGMRERRLEGAAYDGLVDEFVEAVQDVFPRALIQFEDFANENAFRLLARYRDKVCSFNDDIQGTAAVALAGLLSAGRAAGRKLCDETILFCGAGEAALGIGALTVQAMKAQGLSAAQARARCWFFDSKGLVESSRDNLTEHKRVFAHAHAPLRDLAQAVRELKPTALIGVSGKAGQFTQEIVEAMAANHERPAVFALSNPTANSECTAEQAYRWSGGRALFASGSPFGPVSIGGRTHNPGQGNNAYIFPGIGLGIVVSGAGRVTDEMFLESAKVLAACVTEKDLAEGRLYPPLVEIRKVSAWIAQAVAELAYEQGLCDFKPDGDPLARIRALQYEPVYKRYV